MTPRGFSSSHVVYDTTAVVGAAMLDPNFNVDAEGQEEVGPTASSTSAPDGWVTAWELDRGVHGMVSGHSAEVGVPCSKVIQRTASLTGFRQLYGIRALAGAHRDHVVHDGHRRRRRACDGRSPRMAQSRGTGRFAWRLVQPLGDYVLVDATGRTVERDNAPIPC